MKKILLVEQNPDFKRFYERWIRRLGWDVLAFSYNEEAFEAFKERKNEIAGIIAYIDRFGHSVGFVETIRQIDPEIPIKLTYGHSHVTKITRGHPSAKTIAATTFSFLIDTKKLKVELFMKPIVWENPPPDPKRPLEKIKPSVEMREVIESMDLSVSSC